MLVHNYIIDNFVICPTIVLTITFCRIFALFPFFVTIVVYTWDFLSTKSVSFIFLYSYKLWKYWTIEWQNSCIYGNHKTLISHFSSWLLILLGNHGAKGTSHILRNVLAFAFFWYILSTNLIHSFQQPFPNIKFYNFSLIIITAQTIYEKSFVQFQLLERLYQGEKEQCPK